MTERAVSVALWTAGLAWLVPMMSAMMALGAVISPKRTDWFSRIYCRGQVALSGASWRAVVDPAVDPEQPYMFMQNHVNLLDHVSMYNATPHFKQGLELEDHFKIPVYGWFMKSRGTIPVRRGSQGQTKEIMAHMRGEMEQGNSILAFPEGTRTLTGQVGKLRKGVFYIARDLGIPIVPTTVVGMYDVLRKGSMIMRAGKQVVVYCDAPIETAGRTDREMREIMGQVKAVMAARLEESYGPV